MSRGYAIVGLFSPKSSLNVGGAMRAAYCYGANSVVVQGERYSRQPTDTQAAFRHVPVHQVDSILSFIPMDATRVAVEITPGARDLRSFSHPERAVYIFGPEDGSIPDEISAKCKHRVYIPTKFCMNLAATVNVVLYDRMTKAAK